MRIALNGVTGRMGRGQHLPALLALRETGLDTESGVIDLDITIVGRNADAVAALGDEHDVAWTTDLDEVFADESIDVFADAQTTLGRTDRLRAAIRAGKAIYTEKPLADTLADARELVAAAQHLVTGVVHNQVYFPGLVAMADLVRTRFFGRILSVDVDFGYWVFTGEDRPAQRPSWCYRAADGGGTILDVFPHFDYMLTSLVGPVRSILCHATTQIPERLDEDGARYAADADDDVNALVEFDNGVTGRMLASWTRRPQRDELTSITIHGTKGSARCGYFTLDTQPATATPVARWNPESADFGLQEAWTPQELIPPANPFAAQWTEFLQDVAADRPHRFDFASGARGVALVDAGLRSVKERCWVDVEQI